jgi:hypothetical protein
MTSGFSVFISHVSEDESIAIAIKQFIEKVFLNATVFVAGRDLIGGEVWIKEIRDKLRTSRVIVSIITPFSQNSSWVLFESGAGFLDSRTIPLCGDDIAIEDLKPPLKLLQARAINQEGLQNLVRDVARLAELREPSEYPGLTGTLNSIDDFLNARSQATKGNAGESSEPKADTSSKPIKLHKLTPDQDIQEKVEQLEKRLRDATIRSIEKAASSYAVPSRAEMEKMRQTDLNEVARYFNIPYPVGLYSDLALYWLDPVARDASRWKKMNAQKSLEQVLEQIEKFEASL